MIELEFTGDNYLRIMVSESKDIKRRTNIEVKVIEHLFADLENY